MTAMDDRHLEERLRRVLHAEVETQHVTITPADVQRRLAARHRQESVMRTLAAAAAVLVVAAGVLFAVMRPTAPPVGESPTPPTDAPSIGPTVLPSPTPVLGAAESAGVIQLALEGQAPVEVAAVCEWSPFVPARVIGVDSGDRTADLFGERVNVAISLEEQPLVSLHRPTGERAPYQAYGDMLTGATLTDDARTGAALIDEARTGRITFDRMVPAIDGLTYGLFGANRFEQGQPLGEDPAAQSLSGRVEWTCDPAPAAYAPVQPEPSLDPFTTPAEVALGVAGAPPVIGAWGCPMDIVDRDGATGDRLVRQRLAGAARLSANGLRPGRRASGPLHSPGLAAAPVGRHGGSVRGRRGQPRRARQLARAVTQRGGWHRP